jgi:hypothetical protein
MGGKVGGISGDKGPARLDSEHFAEKADKSQKKGSDPSIQLATPVDERPAQLTAPANLRPKEEIEETKDKRLPPGLAKKAGDDEKQELKPPGHDESGPGNSENAPGHNKEAPPPPPPPPPPEPVRQAVEQQQQVQQQRVQEQKAAEVQTVRVQERRRTEAVRIERKDASLNKEGKN